MTIGPMFADPLARQLYAEIASIEEQHVTQYESIIDPTETWLEKWLLHEANEVYNYFSCVEYEQNAQVKQIWERFLDYELGHLRFVAELFENTEKRDAAEVLEAACPAPIRYASHRAFVRDVLRAEVHPERRWERVCRSQPGDAGDAGVSYPDECRRVTVRHRGGRLRLDPWDGTGRTGP